MALERCMKFNLYSFISFVMALLLLSVTVQGQEIPDELLKLGNLFEEALVNRSENIFQLRRVYFNPSSVCSPMSVCLKVNVYVDNIQHGHGRDIKCFIDVPKDRNFGPPAFERCNSSIPDSFTSGWCFASSYKLKLADNDCEGNASQLSDLLTNSGSTGVFYAFDPTFYNIIKALSVSIAVSFPYYYNIKNPSVENDASNNIIEIHINEDLQNMPCWSDVDFELRMVLVWVSIGIIYYIIL